MDNALLQELLTRIETLERRTHQMVVRGTISEVDPDKALAKVQWGPKQFTGWLPFKPARSGQAITWWCPEVGEPVTILSDGELSHGEILPGSYSATYPAPSTDPDLFFIGFGDGATISYDRKAHKLIATLPDGGTTQLTSPGGITLTGDTQINGTLGVSKDTTITGKTHSKGAVSCDADVSDSTSSMQAMRDVYNSHDHAKAVAKPVKRME